MGGSGLSFVLWRGMSGCAEASLLWIAGGIIAFSQTPAKFSAIFVGRTSRLSGRACRLLPVTLSRYGCQRRARNACSAVPRLDPAPAMATLRPAGSRERDARPRFDRDRRLRRLAGEFLFYGGNRWFWVFVEPIATAHHVTPAISRFADASNLAAQFAGAVFATVLAQRLARVVGTVLVTGCAAVLVALALVSAARTTLHFSPP